MTSEEKLAVTVEEAARRIDISRSHAYQLVADGEIPAIRIGSQLRIPLAALDAWLARKLAQAK